MIRVSLTANGDLRVTQGATSPAVYLDHWALRLISEDDAFSARFVTGLEARDGTLALSWVNLVEFARVTAPEQIRRAEELVEASLARLFLLEVDPFVVIRRKDELLVGAPPRPPHADADFLRLLATVNPKFVAPLSARGLFHGLRDPGVDNGHRRSQIRSFTRLSSYVSKRRTIRPLRQRYEPLPKGHQSSAELASFFASWSARWLPTEARG